MVLGRVCTVLGAEPDRVWSMEWADVARLYRYWRESPPVHELVAAYLGVKPSRGREAAPDARPDIGMTGDEIRAGFHAATPEAIRVGP
jgi:hypothetical protein